MEKGADINISTGNFMGKGFFIHIACEVVIIGGISIYFYNKMNKLESNFEELKKSIKSGRGISEIDEDMFVKSNRYDVFEKHTQTHMSQIFGILKQFSSRIQSMETTLQEYQNHKDTQMEQSSSCNLHQKDEESLDVELDSELKELENKNETLPQETKQIQKSLTLQSENVEIKPHNEEEQLFKPLDEKKDEIKSQQESNDNQNEDRQDTQIPPPVSENLSLDVAQCSQPIEFITPKKKGKKRNT